MKKKNKCCGKHQIHGCIETDTDSELNDLLNKPVIAKTALASKYQDKLGTMTLEELQDLSEEIGIIPIDNRDTLIKAIKREFKNN